MSDPSSDAHTHPLEISSDLTARWWVPLLTGALNLIAGLVVLLEPHTSLLAIALVLGIYLVIAGLATIGVGVVQDPVRWVVAGLGLLSVIAGGFVIARPGSAIHGVLLVFGIYLVFAGCLHLAGAAMFREVRSSELLRALLDVAAGIVFLAAPKLGLTALALFIGLYLLVRAVLELGLAWALYGLRESSG